jgi:CBS domain-containing protein
MDVRDVMTRNPACCAPDTNLQQVACMMVEYDCGAIPVIDAGSGKPIGIVTDRDITVRAVANCKNPLELSARDCMTAPVCTIGEDASLDECLDLVEAKQIRRMLVVDRAGKCIGIVAAADLAEHASKRKAGELLQKVSQPASVPIGGDGVRAR